MGNSSADFFSFEFEFQQILFQPKPSKQSKNNSVFLLALLNHALKHVEKWLDDFFEELQFADRESRLEVRGMVFC